MSVQSDEFYNNLATALITEVGNVNIRVKIANKLADIFELADTPAAFNRTAWIEQVRTG